MIALLQDIKEIDPLTRPPLGPTKYGLGLENPNSIKMRCFGLKIGSLTSRLVLLKSGLKNGALTLIIYYTK